MHGFVAINKPSGISSAQATHRVRNSFSGTVTAGHTGTLDPLAVGVLVVALNGATRFIQYLLSQKAYLVEFQLGMCTDTLDSEGEIITTGDVPSNFMDRLEKMLPYFVGQVTQEAPAYSALKYKGKPLYAYARKGEEVPRKVRQVEINHLAIQANDESGRVNLEVECGPGTYIRSLVADLGKALGCGAVVTGLQRTLCCGLGLDETVALPASDLPENHFAKHIIDCKELLWHYPAVTLSAQELTYLSQGKELHGAREHLGIVRIMDCVGNFQGLGKTDGTILKVDRLLPLRKQVGQAIF